MEIQPFRACAMKNTQYSRYLWPNHRNFRILKEIRAEEHGGDVRFFTGSGNTAGSRMHNASGHNYWNSSFIMDPRPYGADTSSTERISSSLKNHAQSSQLTFLHSVNSVLVSLIC